MSQQSSACDWRSMPEGREKYQAYLCGREWGQLREKVRLRCGGVCERCKHNAMAQVHHLTYERKYGERLEDLQAICRGCHEFTHAKSDFDPLRHRPVIVAGKRVRKFYLAGKITGHDWRAQIVPEWSEENHSTTYYLSGVPDSRGKLWEVVIAISEAETGVFLDYVGPWWYDDCGCGHGSSTGTKSPHAYVSRTGDQYDDAEEKAVEVRMARGVVAGLVEEAVNDADMMFAWIDSDDCLGTMLELGMALARGIPVVVASPASFSQDETWLVRRFADFNVTADSAGEAWTKFWAENERRRSK